MKKLIALMLAVLLVVGLFAGCNSTGTETPTTKPTQGGSTNTGDLEFPYEVDADGNPVYGDLFKDVTIEWWVSSHYDLSSDSYIFKKLEELVGCQINVKRYDSETYAVKIATALKTNKLPDICALGAGSAVAGMYGDRGALVNLIDPENLAKMPNLKKILDIPAVAENIEFYKSDAGALYSFPRYNTNRLVNFGWMYREDIFEKNNIELWHDNESFLNVLRQLKKLYPNSYPLTGASMMACFDRMMSQHGANAINLAYDWENEEWFIGATHEGYYEAMMVFKTAWNEGLVDPDIFSNKTGDITSAIVNGDSFVYNSWIGYIADQNYAGRQVDPNFQVSYAPQIGDGKYDQLELINDSGVVINAQSESVDACLAIWNALYADEGRLATVGEEGVTYKMEDGKKVYLKADGSVQPNPTIQTLEEQFGLWNSGLYMLAPRDSVYFTFTPEEQKAQDMGEAAEFFPRVPLARIPQDMGETYADNADKLFKSIESFCTDFVTKDNVGKAEWEAQCKAWNEEYSIVVDILNGNY